MRKAKETQTFDFRPLGLAIREARELSLIHIFIQADECRRISELEKEA